MTSRWCSGSSTRSSRRNSRRALQDRIEILEEFPIAGEEIVFPEMLAEPGTAHGPHAEPGCIDRSGPAPEVDVVVRHPAAAVVVDAGGLRAGDGDLPEHVEEGLVALGEVRHLGRPVVHLGVDVDRVLAAPGWRDRLIPDALEVGGLSAGAAAGDQEIAAELEAEGLQVGIGGTAADGLEPLIGGRIVAGIVADLQMHAAHQREDIVAVATAQGVVIRAGDPGEDPLAGGAGVGGDVAVVDIAGGGGDQEGDGVGSLDVHALLAGHEPTAGGDRAKPGLEAQALALDRGDQRVPDRDRPFPAAVHHHRVGPGEHPVPIRTLESGADRHPARLVGGEAHDQDPVGVGDEDLAGEDGVAHAIADQGDAGLQVELAAVIRRGLFAVE